MQGTASAILEKWSIITRMPVLLLSEGQILRWSYWTNSLNDPLWIFLRRNRTSPGVVPYLLAREALTHVVTNATTNAWPGMAFLYSRQHLSDALVAHCIVSTKQIFMLVQLRHYNHARTFVQRTLLRWILHTKDPILVEEQEIVFLLVIVTCE